MGIFNESNEHWDFMGFHGISWDLMGPFIDLPLIFLIHSIHSTFSMGDFFTKLERSAEPSSKQAEEVEVVQARHGEIRWFLRNISRQFLE